MLTGGTGFSPMAKWSSNAAQRAMPRFSEKEKLDFSALDSALADAALVRPEVRPEKLFVAASFYVCGRGYTPVA